MDASLKNKISEYFSQKPVIKAYIFGSQAKGTSNTESDLDILVELDHTSPIGLKFVQIQLDLQEILKLDVDLVTFQSLSEYIKPNVDREKELIYER